MIGEIDTLPGCSQIAVSHSVFIPGWDKGPSGCGKLANFERQKLVFDELGYDYLLCSVDSANIAQIKILETCGWKLLDMFKSRKTGHMVQIWGILRGGIT